MEATRNSDAIASLLIPLVSLMSCRTHQNRTIAEAKKGKTDKVDALILAQLPAADYLPPAWLPDRLIRSGSGPGSETAAELPRHLRKLLAGASGPTAHPVPPDLAAPHKGFRRGQA